MSPVDRDIVIRKLERIVESLRLLEPMRELSVEEYGADVYRRKAIERLLQEVVESAVDLNAHLLVGSGEPAPDDLFTSFLAIGDLGILDRDLARSLAPSAGLRNRLVHEYDRIDDSIVLAAVRSALDLFPRYVASVERFADGS
ncbi:MAG: DUF86 domain-containing protein [Planctomycetota bacterium JB042]